MARLARLSDQLKFSIFCLGLAVAMSSSMIFLFVLCLNVNGIRPLQYENNPLIATIEIGLLVMATATCFIASEIYYKYLKLKAQTT